jgi:hypothetical protein
MVSCVAGEPSSAAVPAERKRVVKSGRWSGQVPCNRGGHGAAAGVAGAQKQDRALKLLLDHPGLQRSFRNDPVSAIREESNRCGRPTVPGWPGIHQHGRTRWVLMPVCGDARAVRPGFSARSRGGNHGVPLLPGRFKNVVGDRVVRHPDGQDAVVVDGACRGVCPTLDAFKFGIGELELKGDRPGQQATHEPAVDRVGRIQEVAKEFGRMDVPRERARGGFGNLAQCGDGGR